MTKKRHREESIRHARIRLRLGLRDRDQTKNGKIQTEFLYLKAERGPQYPIDHYMKPA